MNWFRSLDTIARRFVVLGILACLLIVVGLTFSLCRSRDEAARARVGERIADAQAGLGGDALKRADDLAADAAENRAQTDRNTDFITGAENANQSAGDAGDRGRLAFCDRQRVRQRPEPDYCPGLRLAYPAKP